LRIAISVAMTIAAPRKQGAFALTSGRGKGHKAILPKVTEVASPARLPTDAELVAAVESLSLDQLRPYGRLIRKRLAELVPLSVEAPDADIFTLKRLCDCCPQLVLEHESEADWFVVVRGTFPVFIDIYNAEDYYSEDLWSAFATYLEIFEHGRTLPPGGRYVYAQGLISQNLPFLEGMSLGEVSHIVQIAMTSRKLLGYRNAAIVPYARSETAIKEQCAEYQILTKKTKLPLATWDVLRTCLQELLMQVGEIGFPLSNVKRVLRVRFKFDLSETALGYVALSELFKDFRIQDLCSVRLLDNGYYVFPHTEVLQPSVDPVALVPMTPVVAPVVAPQPSIFSTTPFVRRGTDNLVNIPGASVCGNYTALQMQPLDGYACVVNASQTFQSLESSAPQTWSCSGAIDCPASEMQRNNAEKVVNKPDTLDEGLKAACEVDLGSTLDTTLGVALGSTLGSTLNLGSPFDSTLNMSLGSTLREPLGSMLGETFELTLREPLDSMLGDTPDFSPRALDDFSTNCEDDVTAPPTPRGVYAVTPSPDHWRNSIFEEQIREAVKEAAQPILAAPKMQTIGDCVDGSGESESACAVCREDQAPVQWSSAAVSTMLNNVSGFTVKNTFISVDSPALDSFENGARRYRSKSCLVIPSKQSLTPTSDCMSRLRDFAHQLRKSVKYSEKSFHTVSDDNSAYDTCSSDAHENCADDTCSSDAQSGFQWMSGDDECCSERTTTRLKIRFGCFDSDSDSD